ncbi:MAG: winged helix-turn-helix transcriptional regulator, partial [Promethearchaeota archaeon]
HLEDDGIDLSMEYSLDSEGEEGVEIDFDLEISRLIEYNDSNADSRYTPDNDTIIGEYKFDSFKDLEYLKTPITESSSLHEFIFQTIDNNVTFHFYFAEEFVNINGASLAPQQMKFDIEIDHFNYTSPSSALALDVEMISEYDYEHDEDTEDEEEGYDHDEEWLTTASTDLKGFFSWKEFAIIDGMNKSIGTYYAPKDGEDPGAVYLSYPRGDLIFHDPELGVAGIIIKPGIIPPPIDGDGNFPLWAIILIVISSILVIFFGLMSKQEYRNFLLNRISDYSTGPHRLTMEDVLDNKIRNRIISIIMDEPGVHYSELERKVDTSSSNLAWHLDILETYHIINKRRVGRYLIFYPYVEKNPFAELDVSIVKSKTTLEIFQIIADNPGINQSHLTKRMDMHRKTVKYHLDKLIKANIVEQKKEGTKMTYNSLQ